MTGGIGTRGRVIDGVYTGELDGPFCYGQGKVEAITDLARWDNLDLAQCYAYSDSSSDLPMLSAIGHPVVVNPDRGLMITSAVGLAAGAFAIGMTAGARRAGQVGRGVRAS
jgi:phosphoserine phosphatase